MIKLKGVSFKLVGTLSLLVYIFVTQWIFLKKYHFECFIYVTNRLTCKGFSAFGAFCFVFILLTAYIYVERERFCIGWSNQVAFLV